MLSQLHISEIFHELQIAEESMLAYKHQIMRNKGSLWYIVIHVQKGYGHFA